MGVNRESDPREVVKNLTEKFGLEITIAVPLGLGKPIHLLNALYRHALRNENFELTIITALSLQTPKADSQLEKRLLDPMNDRLFGTYPDLEYARDRKNKKLPCNVSIHEFYLQPGSLMDSNSAQQDYISTNYTYAARDITDRGIDVLAQLVTPARDHKNYDCPVHSLSCNADLTLDVIDQLQASRDEGTNFSVIGEVNSNLPFMYGDCLITETQLDSVLESKQDYNLFGTPSEPVSDTDYAIGVHASRLIPDGGTIQIGIGSLSEALSRILILRDNKNDIYQNLVHELRNDNDSETASRIGGTRPFQEGLYGSTEMFVRGFEELYKEGIISRSVFDHPIIQEYVDDRNGDRTITPDLIDRLLDSDTISHRISESDFHFLQHYGIFKKTITLQNDKIIIDSETSIPANLRDSSCKESIFNHATGDCLRNGTLIHAGFFLGPPSMYEFLRNLDEQSRKQISMTRISYVNNLHGEESLKRKQRKKARFLNSAMKVTVLGGVVSDTLENAKVVSGVGGQYNFVAMAHELSDGRSIIMLPSTRRTGGEVESNIVWNYGRTTIPRHMRDIVVTEYGIANLRGCTDRESIEKMISITDSRFQQKIVQSAKESGKLPCDWELPDRFKRNTPDAIKRWKKNTPQEARLNRFPFGNELSGREMTIIRALRALKKSFNLNQISFRHIRSLPTVFKSIDQAEPYLERMDLFKAESWSEFILQKVLLYGLSLVNEI